VQRNKWNVTSGNASLHQFDLYAAEQVISRAKLVCAKPLISDEIEIKFRRKAKRTCGDCQTLPDLRPTARGPGPSDFLRLAAAKQAAESFEKGQGLFEKSRVYNRDNAESSRKSLKWSHAT
jgi:hypothetical protein